MSVKEEIKAFHQEMIQWRRDIHQHPELGFEEHRTSSFVAEKLQEFGLEVHQGLAKTGVVGSLRNGNGQSIGMRADLDALPIAELNDFAHKSVNDGKMHACGHDGHTTMLLGAAKYLSETRKFRGTVHFIFQPAEEGGGGGDAMVKEGLFQLFPVDAVYGMHNWPGMPPGTIGSWAGPMMAAADTYQLVVRGKGGHAAMPDMCIDPVVIGSQIVSAFQTIASRTVHPVDSVVVSVTRFQGGTTDNVIPDTVTLGGTVRTFQPETRDTTENRMKQIAKGICAANNAGCEFQYKRGYPATINHATQTEIALRAAAMVVGEENVIREPAPVMGSEDFSYMILAKPGCYLWIGNGDRQGGCLLHNALYDFNDDILPIGASFWAALAENEQQQN